MISREFLDKGTLRNEDCKALATLITVILKGPQTSTLSILPWLAQLQMSHVTIEECIYKQMLVLFEQLTSQYQQEEYFSLLRILFELLAAYEFADCKVIANGIFTFWSSLDLLERGRLIDFFKKSSSYSLLVRLLPPLIDPYISKLKYNFILQVLKLATDFQEQIVVKLLKDYPQDNSNDWSFCFSQLALYCSEHRSNNLEVLYSFMDALYVRKFSVANLEDVEVICNFLACTSNPQFTSYCMSRFNMSLAAGFKPGTLSQLPFHQKKFSHCSLRFIISFLNKKFVECLKPLLKKLFTLFTPNELLQTTFWPDGIKLFKNYSSLLDGLWEESLAVEALKNTNLLKHLYENSMAPHPATLLKPLNMTLNFEPGILLLTLQNLDQLMLLLKPNEIESFAYVYMSAALKAFLIKPSQCSHGYIMTLMQPYKLFIDRLCNLMTHLGKEKNLDYYNPLKSKWFLQVENLEQTCRLLFYMHRKLGFEVKLCFEWVIKLLDPDATNFPEVIDEMKEWALHCFKTFEKEDKEMNPLILSALFKADFCVSAIDIRNYIRRWAYLDWSPLLPFIFLRMGDWELGKCILQQCDNFERIFIDPQVNEHLLKACIERVNFLGIELVEDLLISYNKKCNSSVIHRECLDMAENGTETIKVIMLMASPVIPSARYIFEVWASILTTMNVRSIPNPTYYNYTEFSNQVTVQIKSRMPLEELFCQFTKWCLAQPMLAFMEQVWMELLVMLKRQNHKLYQMASSVLLNQNVLRGRL